jgi:hypothetical protein
LPPKDPGPSLGVSAMFEKLGDWEEHFKTNIQRSGRSNSTSRAILLPVVPDRIEWDAFVTTVQGEWENWRSQLSGYPASLLMLYCGLAFYEYDENRFWPQFAKVIGSEELPANQQSEINTVFATAARRFGLELKLRHLRQFCVVLLCCVDCRKQCVNARVNALIAAILEWRNKGDRASVIVGDILDRRIQFNCFMNPLRVIGRY